MKMIWGRCWSPGNPRMNGGMTKDFGQMVVRRRNLESKRMSGGSTEVWREEGSGGYDCFGHVPQTK